MDNKIKTVLKSIINDKQVKDTARCLHHTSEKIWKSIGTLKVVRTGNGEAIKTVKEECKLCKAIRVRKIYFTDTRVIRAL